MAIHDYRSDVADFIATVSPDALGNWEICKREQLWGVIERRGSSTGAANARRVDAGDRIFIWLGKPRRGKGSGGLKAQIVAVGGYEAARPGLHVPWPAPADYAGVIPINLVDELADPVPDRFPAPNRIGTWSGLENTALIHGFREISVDVAERLEAEF